MPEPSALFRQYRDDIYRLALSYTRSPQEAEDICQTTFLRLLEHPNITPGKEKAWLMQTCANLCRNLLRSHWWKLTDGVDETTPAPQREDSFVGQALMKLDPKYRVVTYLYYYEQYTTQEIAKLLKISPSNVSTRLHRARQQLKELLKED